MNKADQAELEKLQEEYTQLQESMWTHSTFSFDDFR